MISFQWKSDFELGTTAEQKERLALFVLNCKHFGRSTRHILYHTKVIEDMFTELDALMKRLATNSDHLLAASK